MKKISNEKKIIIEKNYLDGVFVGENKTEKFVYERGGKFVSRWSSFFREVIKQPDGSFLMEVKAVTLRPMTFKDVLKRWGLK